DHARGRPPADRAVPHLRPDPRPPGEAARPLQGRGAGEDREPSPGGPTRRRAEVRRLARAHRARRAGAQRAEEMSRKPSKTPAKTPARPGAQKPGAQKPGAKVLEAAARPVEVVGQTIERAFDPLTSALKRAALKRADRQAAQFAAAAPASAKDAMPVSPLAVPFPQMPPIAGVQMATARAGFYKHERDDLLVMSFPEGASCAGVFTRHGVGSAPVDWCKRHLQMTKGEGVRALVVNAGCANSFTGRPGAD